MGFRPNSPVAPYPAPCNYRPFYLPLNSFSSQNAATSVPSLMLETSHPPPSGALFCENGASYLSSEGQNVTTSSFHSFPSSQQNSKLIEKSWTEIVDKVCAEINSKRKTPEHHHFTAEPPKEPINIFRTIKNVSPNCESLENSAASCRASDTSLVDSCRTLKKLSPNNNVAVSPSCDITEERVDTCRALDNLSPNCEPGVTCGDSMWVSSEPAEETMDPYDDDEMLLGCESMEGSLNVTILNPPPPPLIGRKYRLWNRKTNRILS